MTPVGEDGVCPSCGLTSGTYTPLPHHIPPGTVLMGRYLVGRVLGEGGFGITYIGCDLRLELKVAIKEYFPTNWGRAPLRGVPLRQQLLRRREQLRQGQEPLSLRGADDGEDG